MRQAPAVAARHRLEMARIAVSGRQDVVCNDLEIRRREPSYTILTLESLARQHPGAALVLVVGADAFCGLDRWHRYQDILALANIAVVNRGDAEPPALPAWAGCLERRQRLQLSVACGQLLDLRIPPCEVSATEVRRLLANRADVTGMVPPAVLSYIQSNDLYV